jgi:hypothetical protein
VLEPAAAVVYRQKAKVKHLIIIPRIVFLLISISSPPFNELIVLERVRIFKVYC